MDWTRELGNKLFLDPGSRGKNHRIWICNSDSWVVPERPSQIVLKYANFLNIFTYIIENRLRGLVIGTTWIHFVPVGEEKGH